MCNKRITQVTEGSFCIVLKIAHGSNGAGSRGGGGTQVYIVYTCVTRGFQNKGPFTNTC